MAYLPGDALFEFAGEVCFKPDIPELTVQSRELSYYAVTLLDSKFQTICENHGKESGLIFVAAYDRNIYQENRVTFNLQKTVNTVLYFINLYELINEPKLKQLLSQADRCSLEKYNKNITGLRYSTGDFTPAGFDWIFRSQEDNCFGVNCDYKTKMYSLHCCRDDYYCDSREFEVLKTVGEQYKIWYISDPPIL